ncbi:MAG: hypothetical protein SOW92_03010 [Kiritimatiellia bacterium]|nr:hypothetical protein [Kiritimatiellia bacterium]
MSKKFTDLSQLTKAILKKDEPQRPKPVPAHEPIPHPVKPAPAAEAPAEAPKLSREEADCLAYFSHTSIADRRFATAGRVQTPPAAGKTQEPAPEAQAELSKLMAAEAQLSGEVAELRQKLEAAEARAAAAEQALEAHIAKVKSGEEQRARLEAEIRELRAKAPEPPRVAPAPQLATLSEPPVPRERKGVLAAPAGFAEAFTGEVREMVVAALSDACETARQSTRERRAAVLAAVLAANPSSGELARRRAELRQIVKDAAYHNDEHMLKGLEKLGMKLISGKKHWKLEYGNVRMPMSKTPSDYRSGLNSSADMANRCF